MVTRPNQRNNRSGHTLRAALLVLLFLSLSGCADSKSGDADARSSTSATNQSSASHGSSSVSDTGSLTSDPPYWHVNETFSPTVVKVFGPVGHENGSQGTNCIMYRSEEVDFVATGSVEVQWTPNLEAHRVLRLSMDELAQPGEALTVEGPSPLRLEFNDFTVDEAMRMFIEPTTEPSAFYEQKFDFSWQFTYAGTQDAPWSSCSSG